MSNPLKNTLSFLTRYGLYGLAVAFLVLLIRPLFVPGSVSGGAAPPVENQANPNSFAGAVERAAPAVVSVYTQRVTEDDLPGASEINLGSGVIVSEKGHVLTNHHLVQGSQTIRIALADGRVATARLLGADVETDLAVLQVDLPGVPVMPLGRSDTLRPGDIVLAIGNPYGVGQTVTQGIVSATGRSQLGLSTFEDFIQTDATINPGNSGGALVDTDGRMIGINTAVLSTPGDSGAIGINFAIPVALCIGVLDQILKEGRVIRGWLGLGRTPNPIYDVVTRGVLIETVLAGSPAYNAGLRRGDVIDEIDGEKVETWEQLRLRIAGTRPGTPVTLKGSRGNSAFSVTVTVAERQL